MMMSVSIDVVEYTECETEPGHQGWYKSQKSPHLCHRTHPGGTLQPYL